MDRLVVIMDPASYDREEYPGVRSLENLTEQ